MPVSVSRRALLIGGVVILAVALTAVLVAVNRGGDGPPPVRLADPVLTGAEAEPRPLHADDLPEGCGVSDETIRRYAPHSDPVTRRTQCGWYADLPDPDLDVDCDACSPVDTSQRRLEVGILTTRRGPDRPSAAADALRALEPAPARLVTGRKTPRPVTGLGDEALYRYSPALEGGGPDPAGASLVFRAGSGVVTVGYGGRAYSQGEGTTQVPEKEARAAAFAAATDIARALDVPAKPALTAPRAPATAPVKRVPRPCDLVPGAVVDRLAPDARRGRGSAPFSYDNDLSRPYGMSADTCAWDSPARRLAVTITSIAEWRRGIAVPEAARRYLQLHYDARQFGPGLHGVRGLSDQAFTVRRDEEYTSQGAPAGDVTFRYRNVIVQVSYAGTEASPLPARSAIRGAHTAATHAATTLKATG